MSAVHILIVDDDRDTQELYRFIFESSGYRVSEARSVADGVRLGCLIRPDVVLTDWRLADGNGFAICTALHHSSRTRRVPIVAATGMSLSPKDVARAEAVGCQEVLTKPVDIDVLLRAVGRALDTITARRLRASARRAERFVAQRRQPTDEATMASLMVAHASRSAQPDVALIVADDEGHYVAANESAVSLTGYDMRELTRLSVWDITPMPEAAGVKGLWERFIRAGNQEGAYVVRRRDGERVHTQYVAIANIAPGLHLSALSVAVSSPFPALQ